MEDGRRLGCKLLLGETLGALEGLGVLPSHTADWNNSSSFGVNPSPGLEANL